MNSSEQDLKMIEAQLLAKKTRHRENLICRAEKKTNRGVWAILAASIT